MICPYCNNEMAHGFIPVYSMPLYWIPASSSTPIFRFQKPKDGVKLTDFPVWSAQKAESFYCHDCRVVITPKR